MLTHMVISHSNRRVHLGFSLSLWMKLEKRRSFFWVIQTHNIPVSSLFTAPVGFNKIFGINRELKKERRSGVDWNVFRRFRSGRVFCFYKRSSLHKQTLFRINAATDFLRIISYASLCTNCAWTTFMQSCLSPFIFL